MYSMVQSAYNKKKEAFVSHLDDSSWKARVLGFPKGHCDSVATGFLYCSDGHQEGEAVVIENPVDSVEEEGVQGIFVKDRREDEAYVQETVSVLAAEFVKHFLYDATDHNGKKDFDFDGNNDVDSPADMDAVSSTSSQVAPASFAIDRPRLEDLNPQGPGYHLWQLKEDQWSSECQKLKELRDRLAHASSPEEREKIEDEASIVNQKKNAPSKYPCWQLEEALTYCQRSSTELDPNDVDTSLRRKLRLAAERSRTHCLDLSKLLYLTEIEQLDLRKKQSSTKKSYILDDMNDSLTHAETELLFRKKIAGDDFALTSLFAMVAGIPDINVENLSLQEVSDDDAGTWHVRLVHFDTGIVSVSAGEGWESLKILLKSDDDDSSRSSSSSSSSDESIEDEFTGDECCTHYYFPCLFSFPAINQTLSERVRQGLLRVDGQAIEQIMTKALGDETIHEVGLGYMGTIVRNRLERLQAFVQANPDATLKDIGFHAISAWKRDYSAYLEHSDTAEWFQDILTWDMDSSSSSSSSDDDSRLPYNKVSWKDLPREVHDAAKVLGYTKKIWDNDLKAPIEVKSWKDLSKKEKKAATKLGYTDALWDDDNDDDDSSGFSNIREIAVPSMQLPYNDFDWKELPREVQEAARTLGYTKRIWDDDLPAACESKAWNGLTKKQQRAATKLGYTSALWDADSDNDINHTGHENGSLAYDTYDWKDLPGDVQEAAEILGYSKRIWDEDLSVPCEEKSWNELTNEEQVAATKLGYTSVLWNAEDDIQGEQRKSLGSCDAIPNIKEISFTSATYQEEFGSMAHKLSHTAHEDEISEDSLIASWDDEDGEDDDSIPREVLGIERIRMRFSRRDQLLKKILREQSPTTRYYMLHQERAARQRTLDSYLTRATQKMNSQLVKAKIADFEQSLSSDKQLSLNDLDSGKPASAWSRFFFLDLPYILRALFSALCYCLGHMGLNWMINYTADFILLKLKMAPSLFYGLMGSFALLIMFVNGYLWIWLDPAAHQLKKLDMHNRGLLQTWDARLLRWFAKQSFNNKLDMIAYHSLYISAYAFAWWGMEAWERFVWKWEQIYEKKIITTIEPPEGATTPCDAFLSIQHPTTFDRTIHFFCRHHDDLEGDVPQLVYYLTVTTVAAIGMAKLGNTIFER